MTNAHRPDDEYPLWIESAPPRLSMLERIARRKGEVFMALWLSAAAELVFLSEQSDIAHDLAQLDAMCAKPTPKYQPDRAEALSVARAQQQVQKIKHYGPPQGRTIPVSTVAFILICGFFFAGVMLIELVGRAM